MQQVSLPPIVAAQVAHSCSAYVLFHTRILKQIQLACLVHLSAKTNTKDGKGAKYLL